MGKKIFLLIGTMLIVVLGFVYAWYNYSHVEVINLEDMESIDLNGKDLSKQEDLSQILEQARQDLSDGRVNPRFRIYYQNVEVAAIDHNGNIFGVGNLSFEDSEARSNGYGFFSYLGDSVSEITTGWFTNLFISGTVNSTYVNTSKLCDGTDCYTPSELNTTTTEIDSLSLHLNQDNWYNDSNDWINWDGDSPEFNESKLTTTYYNATQSAIIAGTIDAGSLEDTKHSDGIYDGITFNFTEESGTPGLDLRINFTSITSFNQGVMRYKSSGLSGDYPIIQLWNYDLSVWEDYPTVGESLVFATIEQPVFDSTDHVSSGIVQMRIYKSANGNTNNHYYVDWIAILKGYGTPSGEEVDPYSYHLGNISITGTNLSMGGCSSYWNGTCEIKSCPTTEFIQC